MTKGKLGGYSIKLPMKERHEILIKVIEKDGYDKVIERLDYMVNLRKGKPKLAKARRIFKKDLNWVIFIKEEGEI